MFNFEFNESHIHQHFQFAEITLRIGDAEYHWKKYLSCPPEGLNEEIMFQFLVDYFDAAENSDFDEFDDGKVWTNHDGAVGIVPINRDISFSEKIHVYSVSDEEIQLLMKVAPEMFSYTTDC